MARFPVSVASYSLHEMLAEGKCDVFQYLSLLKYRYHADFADIWSGFLPTLEDDFINKVRGEMDRMEIPLANLCVDGPFVWADTAEEREAHRKEMLRYIEAARKLGARTIRIDFGGSKGHTMNTEAFDYIVKTYREYCAICSDLGMRIGPENHWGWDNVPEYIEKVHDAVDSPAYGHLFHLGNFYDEPEKGTELAISYAMHTHFSANSMPYAKDIVRRLDQAGYAGAYSVEHHSGHLECERVEWQIGTLRELIAEVREENTEPDYISGIYGG